jgi:hypothetical protein
MRVISLQQPWAWLVVSGGKDVENRRWPTRYRGPIAIHASLKLDREYRDGRFRLPDGIEPPPLDSLERGAIVGLATLVECVSQSDSPWFSGPFGFVLCDARPVMPLPWRGALGLRRLPEGVAAALLARSKP